MILPRQLVIPVMFTVGQIVLTVLGTEQEKRKILVDKTMDVELPQGRVQD